MATAAAELTATDTETAVAETEENKGDLFAFEVEGYDKDIEVDLTKVHPEARLRLYKTATKNYILNRISTAAAAVKKSNIAFDSYDAAQQADPLQSHTPKPEGERAKVDYAGIVEKAIKALYTGELGRQKGEGTKKAPKDPLVALVTKLVVDEVYKELREVDPEYKYFSAQKEVGDVKEYFDKRIEAAVANGGDRKEVEKYLENRYWKPSRIQLGLEKPTGSKEVQGFSLV